MLLNVKSGPGIALPGAMAGKEGGASRVTRTETGAGSRNADPLLNKCEGGNSVISIELHRNTTVLGNGCGTC